MPAGHAEETNAKSLLKAMSDYLAAQKAISFDYDSNLELVSKQQQKIALASSGKVALNRNCSREPTSRSRSNGSKSPNRTAGSESSWQFRKAGLHGGVLRVSRS